MVRSESTVWHTLCPARTVMPTNEKHADFDLRAENSVSPLLPATQERGRDQDRAEMQ